MQIEGMAAIVTGGASGLGAATAQLLASEGARVTLFDVDRKQGQDKAAAIGARFEQVDVTDEAAVQDALIRAEASHGIARLCVNCAGVATAERAVDREGKPLPLAHFARVININLVGSFNILSRCAARMAAADPIGPDGERGVIINTASVAAFDGQIGQSAYAASKGGIVGMTLPLAREFARFGIRVVAIAPGVFWTPLMAGLPQEAQESIATQIPFPQRMGRPEEFAALVQAIILNPMLNGETIRLDGAVRMAPR